MFPRAGAFLRLSSAPLCVLPTCLLFGLTFGAGCKSTETPPETGGAPGTGSASTGGSPAVGGSAVGGSAAGGNAAGDGGTGGAAGGGASAGGSGGGGSSDGGGPGGGTGGSVAEQKTFVYVGSGDWGDAEPGLVTVYELDRTSLTLAHVSEHPAGGLASYLAIDQARLRLFAADEADGGLHSFTIDPSTGQLTSLGSTASSNHPVYLSITADGAYVLGANYNEGSVDVYPVGTTGKADSSLGATSTGTQAHCVVLDDDEHVFVPNKGADAISLFGFTAGSLTAGTPPSVTLESPRHLFLQDGRAYVVSEEADLITAYEVEASGALAYLWDVPRLPAGTGSAVTDTGADVRVSPSGKFLYATNRGTSNTVVAYDLQTSPPTLLEHESSLGTTPRNFAMDPEEKFIIVANHGATKTLVIFAIGTDGRLTAGAPLAVDFSPYFVGLAQF